MTRSHLSRRTKPENSKANWEASVHRESLYFHITWNDAFGPKFKVLEIIFDFFNIFKNYLDMARLLSVEPISTYNWNPAHLPADPLAVPFSWRRMIVEICSIFHSTWNFWLLTLKLLLAFDHYIFDRLWPYQLRHLRLWSGWTFYNTRNTCFCKNFSKKL